MPLFHSLTYTAYIYIFSTYIYIFILNFFTHVTLLDACRLQYDHGNHKTIELACSLNFNFIKHAKYLREPLNQRLVPSDLIPVIERQKDEQKKYTETR